MKRSTYSLSALVLAALLAVAAQAEPTRVPVDRPVVLGANGAAANLVAATRAGQRIVVVGDYGTVLLCDDGEPFRQARSVPVQSMLTSVQFIDAQHGWAVGHDGVVLASSDGGETWSLLRKADKPGEVLLSVSFLDARHGFAVGQFGLALETRDGGHNWQPSSLVEALDDPGMHLNGVTSTASGKVLAVGESGISVFSADSGQTWQRGDTGQRGSLWNVIALHDDSFVAAGLRGHLYHSADGVNWARAETGTTESLTGLAQLADGRVVVVGYGGYVLTSVDGGRSFSAEERSDRAPLTAVVAGSNHAILFSALGLVANTGNAPTTH
jgi:photosystem II stability/assembly factor-like uncharacterized protein